MRRLTQDELEEVFLTPVLDKLDLKLYWTLVHWARANTGMKLRTALRQVRRQPENMSLFIDKILRAPDLDDVVDVIDLLASEIGKGDVPGVACLGMLQAWHARTLMGIVIAKRNAISSASVNLKETA